MQPDFCESCNPILGTARLKLPVCNVSQLKRNQQQYLTVARYPESLFSLFSFQGMSYLADFSLLKASFMFMLSAASKPNSLIYAGFFVWYLFLAPTRLRSAGRSPAFLSRIFYFFLYTVISVSPFLVMQAVAYSAFCRPNIENFTPAVWCLKRIPSVFLYVQGNFW